MMKLSIQGDEKSEKSSSTCQASVRTLTPGAPAAFRRARLAASAVMPCIDSRERQRELNQSQELQAMAHWTWRTKGHQGAPRGTKGHQGLFTATQKQHPVALKKQAQQQVVESILAFIKAGFCLHSPCFAHATQESWKSWHVWPNGSNHSRFDSSCIVSQHGAQ